MPAMSDNFNVTQTTQILPLPHLPALNERWTMRRKATLVFAVRSGQISIEEACRVYKLSVDEFLAWERNLERYGIPGLRTTRYQIYRDDARRAERVFERFGNQPGPSPMPNDRAIKIGHPALPKAF
jgi:Protein of unknown function (DUF1153)